MGIYIGGTLETVEFCVLILHWGNLNSEGFCEFQLFPPQEGNYPLSPGHLSLER